MRTSMSVSGSRPEASIESAVMLASRSRTGVSVVESGMVLSFRSALDVRGERYLRREVAVPSMGAGGSVLLIPIA